MYFIGKLVPSAKRFEGVKLNFFLSISQNMGFILSLTFGLIFFAYNGIVGKLTFPSLAFLVKLTDPLSAILG